MINDSTLKQPYEAFPLTFDYSENMATGEVISSVEEYVAEDTDGASAPTFLDGTTIDGQVVYGKIQNGTQALSPYKVTCRVLTDLGNKWEIDATVEVEDN
jgi:hypothetical protein